MAFAEDWLKGRLLTLAPESGELAIILHRRPPPLHKATVPNKLMLFSTVTKPKVDKAQTQRLSHLGLLILGHL